MVSDTANQPASETASAPPTAARRPAVRAPRRLRLPTELLLSVGILIAFLAAWEAFIRVRGLSNSCCPARWSSGDHFVDNLLSGFFWVHIQITLSEILLGFALGAFLGIGLGTLVAQSPLFNRVINPYIIASQAMPKLALAPIFVLWFGFGITPKVFITALIAFFPLFENTITGLNQVDADRLELFRVLRASRWHTFTKLRLPNALPFIFAGEVAAVAGRSGNRPDDRAVQLYAASSLRGTACRRTAGLDRGREEPVAVAGRRRRKADHRLAGEQRARVAVLVRWLKARRPGRLWRRASTRRASATARCERSPPTRRRRAGARRRMRRPFPCCRPSSNPAAGAGVAVAVR